MNQEILNPQICGNKLDTKTILAIYRLGEAKIPCDWGHANYCWGDVVGMKHLNEDYLHPMQVDLEKEIWHRKHEELELCTPKDKVNLALWKLQNLRYPIVKEERKND